jgi:hypothetical protein
MALVAVPLGVVTLMGPSSSGTVDGAMAVIAVSALTVKDAATPLKETLVAAERFDPEMITAVPFVKVPGVKLPMLGNVRLRLNEVELMAEPAGLLTISGPDMAPLGTTAVITVPCGSTVKLAAAPLNERKTLLP